MGNTKLCHSTSTFIPVHPHAYGEHIRLSTGRSTVRGSSPRIWGTRQPQVQPLIALRFIPTHMGNTSPIWSSSSTSPVHPHAYGEHHNERRRPAFMHGSSPRIWGTLLWARDECHLKTVHPHAYGEHLFDDIANKRGAGSSPRIWGTPLFYSLKSIATRFIPTHMGNTKLKRLLDMFNAVHPHAYGEHSYSVPRVLRHSGSSPRIWGTRNDYLYRSRRCRFIPTHMGNTPHQHPTQPLPAVHPHAYGEHRYSRLS